jgi:predicted nicotinamide N-methyase
MIRGAQPGPSTLEIIRAGTRLAPVPLVPEIRLHQAGEPIGMWQRTEEVTGQAGLDPPFWAFAWAGGRALARYLLDHPEAVHGRRVIDVASGSGLVAIAAAMVGAAAVTAYDIDPLAAAAIAVNAEANGVAVPAVCADVLAGDTPSDARLLAGDTPPDAGLLTGDTPPDAGLLAGDTFPVADLVLVADAFYERDLASQVLRFLERSHAAGAAVLAGDFGRTYLPRNRLLSLASYDVPDLLAMEGTDTKRTTIWTLRETTSL